ncbi:hypothetical protein GN244_ATG02380 [Phytophthora infestans]|uniref:Uncharacterized protein n=1 Tax=Phytophthora infestans TaxID=4787 RepID=A0A833WM24_PHYIN|nr:hypothetical protein GN244_ATG02380 [Phytophthora infestans]KAF4149996.1 hypothetical protein GN958_ATG00789 [Phytophthora infestans]
MSTVSSPKVSEFERPPIMEHFKQSKSTRKLNTQPSMPMLGAGGRQLSQDTVQWEPTPDPTTNYVRNDQPPQTPSNDAHQSNSTTFSKLGSLLCYRRR